VFVDVTADWCVVCQSNKKLVINTETINQRIGAAAVPMKADWTSPDPKISAFLSSFGRYGIPLNVVYGPGAPGGVLLPELLTQDAVLKAIDKASGKSSSSSLQPETPHKDAT
jgi:suppressor for copper-sensitivity B